MIFWAPLTISFLCVLLSIHNVVFSAAQLWVRRNPAKYINESPWITLESNVTSVCLYDQIALNWRYTGITVPSTAVHILVSAANESIGSITPLHQDTLSRQSVEESDRRELIRCLINEDHCVPTIATVLANSENSSDPFLELHFDQNTTSPRLANSFQIESALLIQPPLVGSMAYGVWVNAKHLELHVDAGYFASILSSFHQGSPTSFTVRKVPLQLSGLISIRATEVGMMYLSLVDDTRSAVVSEKVGIQVSICDGEVLIPSSVHRLSNSNREIVSPSPVFRIKGVVPITGRRRLTVPHNIDNSLDRGSWSISMWLRLLEGPTGQFRALFYKGSSLGGLDNGSRTPSVWLTPNTNRLAVRASTSSNPDIGSDSQIVFPSNEWVHIAFVFENLTESAGDESSPKYSISVFVNGQVDITMRFGEMVLISEQDLQLFYDGTHPGPRGFAKDITVWNQPLNYDHMRSLYTLGAGETSSIDAILEVFDTDSSSQASLPASSAQQVVDVDLSSNPLLIVQANAFPPLNDVAGDEISSNFARRIWASSDELSDSTADRSLLEAQAHLLSLAAAARTSCASFQERLDIYAEASVLGSAEALFYWSMMVGFGIESSTLDCGMNDAQSPTSVSDVTYDDELYDKGSIRPKSSMVRATYGLLLSIDMGYMKGLIPLSTIMLTSFNVVELTEVLDYPMVLNLWGIPVPTNRLSNVSLSGEADVEYKVRMNTDEMDDFDTDASHLDECSRGDCSSIPAKYGIPVGTKTTVIRHSSPQKNLLLAVRNSMSQCDSDGADNGDLLPLGTSVACWDALVQPRAVVQTERSVSNPMRRRRPVVTDRITDLALGMLYLAALFQEPEAEAMLMHRYQKGVGVVPDTETALYYGRWASEFASTEYHRLGGQPILESDRINDFTEPEIDKGKGGDDDELIRYQRVLADEGNVPAMLAMGDLYYFGARGLQRNHGEAYRYYHSAAMTGDPSGLCAAAGMLVKGETGEKNVSYALELYESAAKKQSVRALNGLGYLYYHGDAVPLNQTKAFEYFLKAADLQTDGDSLYNAGYCLEHGIGVQQDLGGAARLYSIGAQKFGHFDSVKALGLMNLLGRGVPRSAGNALTYLTAAVNIGPWARWLRRGFDHYLHANHPFSLRCYLLAGEFGYEVAQSNAAFILRRKLKHSIYAESLKTPQESLGLGAGTNVLSEAHLIEHNETFEASSLRHALLARELSLSGHQNNKESLFLLGHAYFEGHGVPKEPRRAAWYYSKASAAGHTLSSVYLGVMNQFGLGIEKNVPRAGKYYALALGSPTIEHTVDGRTIDASAVNGDGRLPITSDYAQVQQDALVALPAQIRLLVQSLQWMATSRMFHFFAPVVVSVEYVVQYLWGVN